MIVPVRNPQRHDANVILLAFANAQRFEGGVYTNLAGQAHGFQVGTLSSYLLVYNLVWSLLVLVLDDSLCLLNVEGGLDLSLLGLAVGSLSYRLRKYLSSHLSLGIVNCY